MLKVTNVRYFMLLTPATIGVNVRTIGTNRASTMVLAPCLSKNAWALSTFSCLKNREFGPAEEGRADPPAEQVADLVADHGGEEAADEQGQEREVERLVDRLSGLEAKKPAVKSSESPGRKKPMSRPDSAKTMAQMPMQADLVDQFLRDRAAPPAARMRASIDPG